MFTFLKSIFANKSNKNDKKTIDDALNNLMQSEITNEIERLFVASLEDVHKISDFCKLFLETEFYILGEIVGAQQEEGVMMADKNTQFRFPVFDIQNEPMNFFFTSQEKFDKATQNKEYNKYICCKFSDILIEPEHSFIMNPGYAISKVFDPKLMKAILNKKDVISTVSYKDSSPDEKIYIGIPPKKPEKLVNKLLDYADKKKVLKSIVVAQLGDKEHGTRLCVGIEFRENITNKVEFYGDMQKMFSQIIGKDQYIDLIEKGSNLGNLVFKHGVKIYQI